MKHKLKKIFENAVWWSGVITIGIVLGVSLQFVKAWTEPVEAPPGGNVGAPINTSDVGQTKWGPLQVLGFTLFNDPVESGVDVTGKVLTAQNAYGQVAWAAGGGGGICYTDYSLPSGRAVGADCGGGFTVKKSLGTWGYCWAASGNYYAGGFRPPGGVCHSWIGGPPEESSGGGSNSNGEAYLCCQN